VRGALLAIGIAVALGATGGVAFLALRQTEEDLREATDSPATDRPVADRADVEAPALTIRAYETFRTLAEDLRDALAGDDPAAGKAWDHVRERLVDHPAAMLQWIGRNEPSPRVRALMVLAAGVHVPDETSLLLFLGDPEPVVRSAAALATAWEEGGESKSALLGVTVPLGRRPADSTRALLSKHILSETDEAVRKSVLAALAVE
jgi:hypothetical protein